MARLDATLKGVEHAATLASHYHFFAANQTLKGVDDGVRINEQSYLATPPRPPAINGATSPIKPSSGAKLMEDAEADVLAYMSFPARH